jgi:hypothetical protein
MGYYLGLVFSDDLHVSGLESGRVDMRGWRHLGVAVSQLGIKRETFGLAALGAGQYDRQHIGDAAWRWTDGHAALPRGA